MIQGPANATSPGDPRHISQLCDMDPNCVGFTTSGWLLRTKLANMKSGVTGVSWFKRDSAYNWAKPYGKHDS